MEIRKIKKLIELLEQSHITEIEIKEGDQSLRLSRQGYMPEMLQHPAPHHHQPHHVYHAPAPAHPAAPVADMAPTSAPVAQKNGHTLKAPMVGTVYLASAPDAPSFAHIGQKVNAGDTLCIIEAMKMFNEIEADRTGVLLDVLIKNGDPVEYDQPLFVIQE